MSRVSARCVSAAGPLRLGALALALAALVSCAAGDGGDAQPPATPDATADGSRSPNVVVLVVAGLRADHVGTYGYARATTPTLDRIALDGIVFERAIAAANRSQPAVASLLTGALVSRHGLDEGRVPTSDGGVRVEVLPGEMTTVAEAMREAGLAAGGFVGGGGLAAFAGFDQGYDVYRVGLDDADVVAAFGAWLGEVGARPFFAYLHLRDLRFPYTPGAATDRFRERVGARRQTDLMARTPEALRAMAAAGDLTEEDRQEIVALHDAELLGVDETVGRALGVLRDRGLYRQTLVVVTSDLGQALGEHGSFGSGGELLWDSVMRVPLLIKLPGNQQAGRRIETTVRTIDVLPTLLEALDRPAIDGLDGLALLAREDRGLLLRVPEEPAIAETAEQVGARAIYLGEIKYVFGADPSDIRVYDLATDPGETHDLADQLAPSVLQAARANLERILAAGSTSGARPESRDVVLGPAEVARLRALGYFR